MMNMITGFETEFIKEKRLSNERKYDRDLGERKPGIKK